jgi:Family of unknown function (DUF6582)
MSVARAIATVGGVALKPGVSANRRWYTPEIIADAVTDVQKRLAAGESLDIDWRDDPPRELSQLTHHGAEDDSTRIVGRLTGMSLDEDGNARFTAAIADTPHGRTIASLLDTSDGEPAFLKGVSIRGYWKGTVRKVKGPDGQPAETAAAISLAGLDYTKTPGVAGAQVDTFAWAEREGRETRSSTTERVAIYESVQEARVTITEETAPAGGTARAAGLLELLAPQPHILENGTCVTCARLAEGGNAPGDGSKPYGDVQYADPGYQADKKKRYPVDTKAHVKAALAYLAQKTNAAKYTAAQLKRVKSRIMAAAKKLGVTVSAESAGWTFDAPFQVSEAVAEHYGDPSCSGSWSVRASNGPVDICLSSYSMDPEDLDVILRAAADAACKALAALDPDMDGDVDVPGVGDGSDPDDDAPGETAPDAPTDPAASPAAATTETEDPAMAETTTPAETAAPGIDPKALAEAVAAALESRETAKAQKKAARRQAREAAAAEAARTAQESAAPGQGTPATTGATATETEDQRRARLKALVDEQFATAAKAEGLTAEKTDEQLVAEMIEERMVPLRQARAEGGGVQRKGIAKLEAIADSPTIGKQLQEADNQELKFMAGAAFGPKGTRS